MTWAQFGYICRKMSVSGDENEPVSACLKRVESEKACDLYGRRIGANSLPRKLLDSIVGIQNEGDARKAIGIYKGLNLAQQFEMPMRLKRVIAYLGYVTYVFYVVAGIYQFKVTPLFMVFFDEFEAQIPAPLLFYQDYWLYFVLAVSIFLIFTLLIGFQLKKLFTFNLGVENTFIMRYLVFRSIGKSYRKIIGILEFPIRDDSQPENYNGNSISEHLQKMGKSKMCVSHEMQALLEIEMRFLLEACEKQMKFVSAAVALVLVVAIFFFLVSAYSPIFMFGEIV